MNLVLRKTSREEFESRMPIVNKISPSVANDINAQRRQLVDMTLYSAKQIGVTSFTDQVFASDDDKVPALRNVSSAKIDPNKFICVNRIQILSDDAAAIADATFDELADDVRQGELEVVVDGKVVVSKQSIENMLDPAENDSGRAGLIYLDNPKMLTPDSEIVVRIWFPTDLAANTSIKFALIGTGVETY